MGKSEIQWTDSVWNPVVGCSKVSPGCAHCYAEEVHRTRLSGRGGYSDFRPWTPENAEHNVRMLPGRLDQPLRWREPRMVFVNSMSDLFHELVPDAYIVEVFAVMALARRHVFQVLTKRPERMMDLLVQSSFWEAVWTAQQVTAGAPYDRERARLRREPGGWAWGGTNFLRNVWLGTSIENRRFIERADYLRATPAAVRFISAEPLLGPLVGRCNCMIPYLEGAGNHSPGCAAIKHGPDLDLRFIHWLIVGGESGDEHRPVDPEWVRDLRELAAFTATAFFFKQWGGRTPKAGGRVLDGRTHDDLPVNLLPSAGTPVES